jgi:hypothetical protein
MKCPIDWGQALRNLHEVNQKTVRPWSMSSWTKRLARTVWLQKAVSACTVFVELRGPMFEDPPDRRLITPYTIPAHGQIQEKATEPVDSYH